MKLQKEDVTLHYGYGTILQGQQDVDILPQVSGTLMEIKVKSGEKVRKGQTLFIIDQVPAQAELRVAEADVKVAKASAATAKMNLESKKDLQSKGIISSVQVKKAQNEYETALASIEQAEAVRTNALQVLSFTTVKAPCDGIVGDLPYRVGALVSPNITTPLTTVSDNRNIYAYIYLTESEFLRFFEADNGASIEEIIKSLPQVELKTSIGTIYSQKGRIESLSGVINRSTGTMMGRAIFPNPNGILRSGGAGEVVFPFEVKDAIVIPQSATYTLLDKTFAYKVVDNKTKSVAVSVVSTDDNQNFIVLDGLAEGDVIIADGAANVKEGEEVSYQLTLENL
ncbi:MAG: efflux RND transporter periplasmic adaptor subunit [Bacteroidales bacterium]|nr:efflux RND transporter periplasmic adaptor subunit [Bacteroidales bacterium]